MGILSWPSLNRIALVLDGDKSDYLTLKGIPDRQAYVIVLKAQIVERFIRDKILRDMQTELFAYPLLNSY